MSAETNKTVAQGYFEIALTAHNAAVLAEYLTEDYRLHFPGPPVPPGPEGDRLMLALFVQAFPDFRVIVEDLVATEDKVAARWRFVGTHGGEFQGLPATGRPVDAAGINIFALRDGKICENWVSFDLLALLQQLGAIPPPRPTLGGAGA
jgi:steroid delta-isomerase-like uncharacterized protein